MFYTYFHTRNDTGAVFYVGKGKGRRSHDCDRNQHWNNIVAKHGHTVHIAARWPTEAEAFEHEKFLIACFRDMSVSLCNMTDGGDGVSGLIHSEASKELIRQAGVGRIASAESKAKNSESKKGNLFALGVERTADFKEQVSARFLGKKKSVAHIAKLKGNTNCVGKQNSRGYTHTAEAKEKIGLASRSRSKESLDKQAASLRENWAKRKAAQCQS